MFDPPSELVFQELATFVYGQAPHCADCMRVDLWDVPIVTGDLPTPTFDVAQTLDGAVVASATFRAACADLAGIEFIPLVGSQDRWTVEVDRIVRIDPFGSHVRTGPMCMTCSRPRYVTRTGPVRLESSEPLPSGFSRSDIEFGDSADFGSDQPIRIRPLILVDRATSRALKNAALLGIHLITQA